MFNPQLVPFRPQMTDHGDEFPHSHPFFEIFYITSGTISHSIDGTPKQTLIVGSGYFIAPGVMHVFRRGKEPCKHRDVIVEPDLFRLCCDFIDADFYNELSRRRYIPFKLGYNDTLVLEEHFTDFLRDPDVTNRKRHEKILTVMLLGELTRKSHALQKDSDNFYEHCVDVLNGACTFPDYIQILQNETGYHKVYLCKKFKQTFGVTIGEYVKELRMQFAEYHLKTTDLPAVKICAMAGIESFSYFNKIFKEIYGVTPTEYRKNAKSKTAESKQAGT